MIPTMSPEVTFNGLIQYDMSLRGGGRVRPYLRDEQYMVYAFDLSFFGFNEEVIGTPRGYGVELTYRY